MPYPPRPTKKPLPQFAGTATTRPTPEQRAELIAFVKAGYLEDGLSLRELAELTDRTQTAVRRALDQAGVPRRGAGAPQMGSEVSQRS